MSARRWCAALLALMCAGLGAPLAHAASPPAAPSPPAPSPPAPASAVAPGEPWWVRAGFAGSRVDGLQAQGGSLLAHLDGGWRVVVGSTAQAATNRAPDLGEHAPALQPALIAAPAALPGYIVGADTANTVWRRDAAGAWSRAFLLLPASLVRGAPRITGACAFDQPLTSTVYVATDGYGIIETSNGGADWLRASPGLPDAVLAVLCASQERTVYVATDDGVWAHHLRALPTPPAYRAEDLRGYVAGTALVTLVAALAGILALRRVVPHPQA